MLLRYYVVHLQYRVHIHNMCMYYVCNRLVRSALSRPQRETNRDPTDARDALG